jgi:pyruvate ferredoxin oxidoreductase alpha subunit
VNVSRGLASPITLEPDHNDLLAARDSGCLELHAATGQEVLDLVLLAYRTAEHADVRLPVIVNLDGFYLSFTREPVELPEPEAVRAFLPPFEAGPLHFRGGDPSAQGVAVLGGSPYSYFRYESHLASQAGLGAFEAAAADFAGRFGRRYAPVEAYRCEDAEFAFVMMGAFATKAKAAVDGMRAEGWRIGLVRPVLLRPWPAQALAAALRGLRGVAVVDQNLAPGRGGVLHGEVLATLYRAHEPGPVVAGFVGGLGGRDIALPEFAEMARTLRTAAEQGADPAPRLLYTAEELRQTRALQAVALGRGA